MAFQLSASDIRILERQRSPDGCGPARKTSTTLEQADDLLDRRLLVENRSFDVRALDHSEPLLR